MRTRFQLTPILVACTLLLSCEKNIESPIYDLDAQKFIDSSGITNDIQKSAVNNLVKQLKDSLLWTGFVAIYPMIGGTATTAKLNLKNPENSDAAYRLTFYGNPVYATTGVLFPTTSDYADTHLKDAMLNYNDNSISYYSRTQNTINGYDMGCSDNGAPYNELAIYHKSNATNWFGYYNYGPAPANTMGLFMLSATASNVTRYENGVVKNSKGNAPVPGSTGYPILLGFVSGASSGGARECALASIGNGLTDAQALTFYNIVQNFQIALGRKP